MASVGLGCYPGKPGLLLGLGPASLPVRGPSRLNERPWCLETAHYGAEFILKSKIGTVVSQPGMCLHLQANVTRNRHFIMSSELGPGSREGLGLVCL